MCLGYFIPFSFSLIPLCLGYEYYQISKIKLSKLVYCIFACQGSKFCTIVQEFHLYIYLQPFRTIILTSVNMYYELSSISRTYLYRSISNRMLSSNVRFIDYVRFFKRMLRNFNQLVYIEVHRITKSLYFNNLNIIKVEKFSKTCIFLNSAINALR